MSSQLSFAGQRELRWMGLGDSLVSYIEAEVEIADALWDAWIAAFSAADVDRMMVCSWGPIQPSHQQWRRATRAMRDQRKTVAVVTQARHNLALAKAAAWLGTNIESFRWHQLGDACDHLGIDKLEKVGAKAKIIALRDRFGPVTSHPESGGHASHSPAHTAPLSASGELVLETSAEIQAKLAEIQARLSARVSSS